MLFRFGGSREESGGKEEEVNKKEEPNFALSGKLTAETNTYRVSYSTINSIIYAYMYYVLDTITCLHCV